MRRGGGDLAVKREGLQDSFSSNKKKIGGKSWGYMEKSRLPIGDQVEPPGTCLGKGEREKGKNKRR
jgi:hypothetical protein